MNHGDKTNRDAVTVYVQLGDSDEFDHWDCFIDQVRWAVREKWPSFCEVAIAEQYFCKKCGIVGCEGYRILQNSLCRIVVCECGSLASINLAVLKDLWLYSPDCTHLAERFQRQIGGRFVKRMQEQFDCVM